jgi:hypothetical protein
MTRTTSLQRHLLGAAVGATLLVVGPLARADAEEQRLGVSAAGALASMSAAGVDTSTPAGSLELRYSRGWTNTIELGGSVTLVGGPRLVFENVDPEGPRTDLHTDSFVGVATLDVRLLAGVDLAHAFFRTHPYLLLGVGVATRVLTRQELVDPDPMFGGVVGTPGADVDVRPVVRVGLGVERRMSSGFALSLGLGALYAGDALAGATASVELAWYWY